MNKIDSILSSDAHWNVNKKLARDIGLVPAVLLMELIFCRKKYGEKEFWIQTDRLCSLVNIGNSQRREATKVLMARGYIGVKKKGQPARFFYTINDDKILEFLVQSSENDSTEEFFQTYENRSTRPTKTVEHIKKIEDKKIQESKSHCKPSLAPPVSEKKDEFHKHIEQLTLKEQEDTGEMFVYEYPLCRRHTNNLLKTYKPSEILHFLEKFFVLRRDDDWWKQNPILITSLSSAIIQRIRAIYPLPKEQPKEQTPPPPPSQPKPEKPVQIEPTPQPQKNPKEVWDNFRKWAESNLSGSTIQNVLKATNPNELPEKEKRYWQMFLERTK